MEISLNDVKEGYFGVRCVEWIQNGTLHSTHSVIAEQPNRKSDRHTGRLYNALSAQRERDRAAAAQFYKQCHTNFTIRYYTLKRSRDEKKIGLFQDSYTVKENKITVTAEKCRGFIDDGQKERDVELELWDDIASFSAALQAAYISRVDKAVAQCKEFDTQNGFAEGNIDGDFIADEIEWNKERCFFCGDGLARFGCYDHCLYSFSIERINRFKPHDKDNVRICCAACAKGYSRGMKEYCGHKNCIGKPDEGCCIVL